MRPQNHEGRREQARVYSLASGDFSAGATPDPIPNSAVKSGSADDTTGHTVGKVGHRQNYEKISC